MTTDADVQQLRDRITRHALELDQLAARIEAATVRLETIAQRVDQ